MKDPYFIHFQNLEGIMLWPLDDIAMLRTERSGRLEATSSRGEVAHRPGPLADCAGPPLVKVAPQVYVHPRYARRMGDRLLLPGGWRIPFSGKLPRPAAQPREPIIPELGVRPGEVLYLKLRAPGAKQWMTDRGPLPARKVNDRLAALHPHMIYFQGIYVNRTRIRAFLWGEQPLLLLDNGMRIPFRTSVAGEVLATLGVPDAKYLSRLAPEQESLYLLGLRDWPRLVRKADASELHAMFGGDERVLIANMIWETRELRAQGMAPDDGTSHRAYWYYPLRPVLQRAGAPLGATPEDVVELGAAGRSISLMPAVIPPGAAGAGGPRRHRRWLGPKSNRYDFFTRTLADMVGLYRLLTYEEIGFEEPRTENRIIGKVLPGVVLLVEKETVSHLAFELAGRFGCSMVITGGQPALLATEYFAKALRLSSPGPVQLVAYVDFDPCGWIIPHAFQAQMARYGVQTESVRYLIRPKRFTAKELDSLSYGISSQRKTHRTRIAAWIKKSGGIHGKPAGISADAMRSMERLVAAFHEETGLSPL